jgi:hypothetical protein
LGFPGARFSLPRSTTLPPRSRTTNFQPAIARSEPTTATFASDGALGPPTLIAPGVAAAVAGMASARAAAISVAVRTASR